MVGILHALHRIYVSAAFAFAMDHGIESLEFTVPFLIAIHGIVAAAHGGNFASAQFTHLLLELL